ncbi:MAG: HAD hydrolase family protein, partial [Eubacterium sp.]|nr:HAD hydrolase family protein [Eubacterium sp.]
MKISLIAVDIDGTLLNSNSELSIENLEAIKRLSTRGIMTVPVTGRTYNEIPQAVRNCEDIQ